MYILKRKTKWVLIGLFILVVVMFCFSYALVPLYNVICNRLGVNGKPQMLSIANDDFIDKTRSISVQFLATTNANLPWDFYPNIKKIDIHPGENIKISYHAQNNTNQTMTVQAIPSITPGLAASHLKKTECFCFRQQTLNAHQAIDMPVIFHIDNSLPKSINELTLSYTLFKVLKKIENKTPGRIN